MFRYRKGNLSIGLEITSDLEGGGLVPGEMGTEKDLLRAGRLDLERGAAHPVRRSGLPGATRNRRRS